MYLVNIIKVFNSGSVRFVNNHFVGRLLCHTTSSTGTFCRQVRFVDKPLCRQLTSSTGTFHRQTTLSTAHFVDKPLCSQLTSSTGTFRRQATLSTAHFVDKPLCRQFISSTGTFRRQATLSTALFIYKYSSLTFYLIYRLISPMIILWALFSVKAIV